ncbi:BnaA04g19590D [Brassica napus]|uniref:BnaA04g19590D protein n=1 Tax=Brassica napus TaxID=3708 RepID=A0A078HK77_BRANA|nr:BnaA04g19590D [Brassica napus]
MAIKSTLTEQNKYHILVLGSCLEAEQRGTKKTMLYLKNGQHSSFLIFVDEEECTHEGVEKKKKNESISSSSNVFFP